ncbi:hypothetical protein GCM10017559_08200 [Streptosporangium longisporum]|uniref:Uncharacterized protein n=1 Tax=Streptosporangium longisporum TaxID=46187 RepID=A0ABN3XTW5_9ACTN
MPDLEGEQPKSPLIIRNQADTAKGNQLTPESLRAYEAGIVALASYQMQPYDDLRLNAARASAKVVMAILGHGLLVAPRCGCGQPAGVCELCDRPRCWRCHPWADPARPCGSCPPCRGEVFASCWTAARANECDHPPRAAEGGVADA